MVETAAHLIDDVLPPVPVRQWVLSFPWPLRLLFAAKPELFDTLIGRITRTLVRSGALVGDPEPAAQAVKRVW